MAPILPTPSLPRRYCPLSPAAVPHPLPLLPLPYASSAPLSPTWTSPPFSFLQTPQRRQSPAPPSPSVATPGADAFPSALSVSMPSYASILGASPLMDPRSAVPPPPPPPPPHPVARALRSRRRARFAPSGSARACLSLRRALPFLNPPPLPHSPPPFLSPLCFPHYLTSSSSHSLSSFAAARSYLCSLSTISPLPPPLSSLHLLLLVADCVL
ncbi:unnamed protein product [Closterium sp. Naga37s-1]|nr:unnamed protein product [Closterium sp. Naga37s-1]